MSAAFEVVADSRDRERWLRARRGLLTASDVASALGLSPFKPAVETWAEKTSRWEEAPDRISEPMAIGNELEPWLLSALESRTRCRIEPHGVLVRSKRWPFLGATLDGKVHAERGTPLNDYAGEVGTVEVKSIGGAFADDWISTSDTGRGVLPEHYRPQVITQLAVTDYPFAVFGGLLGGRGFRFRWTDLRRIESEIEELAERCEAWWVKHVEGDECPEPDGSDRAGEVLERLWSNAGGSVLLSAEHAAKVDELLRVRREIRALEKRDAELAQSIRLAMLRDAPEVNVPDKVVGKLADGREVTLARVVRRGYTVAETSFRQLRLPRTGF